MFLLCFVSLLVIFLLYNWMTIRPKNYPPGPFVYPLIGSSLSTISPNLHLVLDKWRTIYGPIIGLVIPGNLSVCINDPKMILEHLKNEDIQSRFISFTLSSIFKSHGMIFTNDEPRWFELKKFMIRTLRKYGPNQENAIVEQFKKWNGLILNNGPIVNGENLFQKSAMYILWEILTGTSNTYDDMEFGGLIKNVSTVLRMVTPGGFIPDLLPSWISKITPKLTGYEKIKYETAQIKEYCEKEVEKHRKTLDPNNPKDLMDSFLLEIDNSRFPASDLFAVVFDLFMAGTDTFNSTLSFGMSHMIVYPDIQKKVQEEIDDVIGENQVTLQDRTRLPYVEATLAEMKRCCPSVPLIPRKSKKNITLYGYNIPKDTNILFNIWTICHDKERFGDPENFRPERFLTDDGKYSRDETLVFFGMAKRSCMGESLARNLEFIFFVSILQKYNLSSPEGEPMPDLVGVTGLIVEPLPFKVKLMPRNKK